ncbi:hypothetical protein A2881_02400 [Candidatus Peribacteria bacterium RIFCSPHIGHO2_01_FULL_55_13]|nr:MAG: hypothetical protein A2881_02400 [Candidatus Peribacteria bacterium RIFCSPHIGHO2_01_FULL_55_13]
MKIEMETVRRHPYPYKDKHTSTAPKSFPLFHASPRHPFGSLHRKIVQRSFCQENLILRNTKTKIHH